MALIILDECINCAIGLAVQQVVKAFIVLAGEIRGVYYRLLLAAPTEGPAYNNCNKEQAKNEIIIHRLSSLPYATCPVLHDCD